MIHLIQQSSKHHGERGITVNKKHFSLSMKLFLITCFSGMLGFATYAMMRANSLSYYQFLHHISIIKFDPEAKASAPSADGALLPVKKETLDCLRARASQSSVIRR